jgi:SAM-dependent methyltransferase
MSFFDRFYKKPGLYYGNSIRTEFEAFIKTLNCQEFNVLDLGCGEGRYSLYLSDFVKNIISVDSSSFGIKKLRNLCNKENKNITAICDDVRSYLFPVDTFDLVVMATLLDHLDKAEQQDLMARVFNSLKTGGRVYANVFTTHDPGYERTRKKASQTNSNISETSSAIKHYFEPSELQNLFNKFDILEYREFIEEDMSHGPVHNHGWAYVIAEKTSG